ncbi:hypothetical protein JCM11251_001824 [Rhodosporidiobolus azoricus]
MTPFLALLAILALALKPAHGLTLDATTQLNAVTDLLSQQQFDYIVVGGGNAGLALASRLSAAPTCPSVLVLEAGQAALTNPGVSVPGLAGSTFLSSLDWAFFTTPQENAGGRSVYWPRGKMLGGTSGLDFLVSTRPNKVEQDQWATLSGNSGWSWYSLLPFYKKAEKFFAPGPNTESEPVAYDPAVHGYSGPIDVSYPPYLSPQFVGWSGALRSLGVPVARDLHSGNNRGVSYAPSTMHNEGTDRTRSYSVDYLTLAPKLVVLTGAQATRINWKSAKDSAGNVVAQGVSFVPTGQNGPSIVVNATREVILSAGTVQSPQLLELSGVGDPAILNPLRIATAVTFLPSGGTCNHDAIVAVFELKEGIPSLDELQRDPATLAAALAEFAAGQGILTQVLYPLAYLTLSDFTNSSDLTTISTLGSRQNNPQLSTAMYDASQALYDAKVPVLELISVNVYFGNATGQPGKNYLSLAGCLQHPLSRGSVHITSSDPLLAPAIDPNYLQSPLDLFLLKRAGQYLRRLVQQPALAQFIQQETEPGPAVQSEAEWEEWVRGVIRTEYHPIGTLALLPRSSGGAVSPSSLKVYGTSNVRVVDLSVAPMHVSSHTQTVAYAIAEKAAELLLSGQ